MRYLRISIIAALLVSASLIFLSFRGGDDISELRKELLLKVISFAVDNGHYDPGNIDDEFSEKAYDLYIDRLDFGKRFLLKEDIDQLSEYSKELDDALVDIDYTFFDLSIDLLDVRTKETQGYYEDILAKPFDFSKQESFEFDTDKKEFAKSKKELKDRWRLSLKYEVMADVYDKMEEQEKALEKSDTVTIKSFDELEIAARKRILKRYNDYYHRLAKLDEDDRLSIYINSLVNVFDPHTQYFPPRDKENFDIRFSGQLEGIGAQLTQKNEYVEVTRIIPGSPSWKQGELEVGDYITKVAQEGEEPVDIVDMRLDDAVQLIRGKKGSKVTLTIKKLDKTINEITLVRDVVVMEETYAKSAVVTDEETGNKYGYLKLPSFYVDFAKINGKNCFDDVKAEIKKLKSENIEGIVFDLRDNGGGSLEDVVKIAGLFIEKGPIVQSSGKSGAHKTYKDIDQDVQYGGPLVVMVNAISASASEIFAAAMQDYNRAIIIGGNSSYGKGTVQNFTELDRMVPKKPAEMKDLGSLKMTVQKFYRINGGATQLKGVVPDIIFPDYYNYMDFGEKDLDNAMPWDEISAVEWNNWTPSYDFEFIALLSEKRVGQDTLFALIEENGKRLKKIRDNTVYSLNYDDYNDLITQRESDGKKYKSIGKDTLSLVVNSLQADLPGITADTSKQARTDAWLMGLRKDIYISEAYQIMKDINAYTVKNARKEEENK